MFLRISFLVGLFTLGWSDILAQPSPPSALEEMKHLEIKDDFKPLQPDPKKQPSFETQMAEGFKKGISRIIADYFPENLDLKILEKENLYSKVQAELILKNFFVEKEPSDFKAIHKGKNGNTNYLIGDLVTNAGNYRIKIITKGEGSERKITLLSIAAN